MRTSLIDTWRFFLSAGIGIYLIISACSSLSTSEVAPAGTPVVPTTASAVEILPPVEASAEIAEPMSAGHATQLPESTAIAAPPTATMTPIPPATHTPLPTATPLLSEPFMGIEIEGPLRSDRLDLTNESGARWLRWNGLLWPRVEPSRGARNWAAVANMEPALQEAANRGLEVILIIRGTPAWASAVSGPPCGPIRREYLSDFASFVREAVERYSAPPFNVKYWELGNEPDIAPVHVPFGNPYGCWGDRRSPDYGGAYYAEMLKEVYPQIKAADPEAQVVLGGLLLDCDPLTPPETAPGSGVRKDCTASKFLTGVLENGGGDFLDGVSFHAYDYYFGELGEYSNPNWHSAWNTTGPVLIAKSRYLRSLLTQYGYPDKFLMNTEVAILCGRTGSEGPCLTDRFNQTKAYYLAQAYAAARAEDLKANIWYSLLGWRASQLANQSLQPAPAYRAYQFSASRLQHAAYLGEVADYPSIKGYEFYGNGKRLWILWSQDGSAHTVVLPFTPVGVYDTFGNPLPVSGSIEATWAPVYVEWDP